MDRLYGTIWDAKANEFYKNAIALAGDWLQFCEWEALPPPMPEYHDILADLYSLNGDMVNATRYARMAMAEWARFGSVDDDKLENARAVLQRLTSQQTNET